MDFNSVDTERANLDSVVIPRSVHERRTGCLSAAHEDRAVKCLEEHGVVILPGLLTPDAVLARGEQALEVGGCVCMGHYRQG